MPDDYDYACGHVVRTENAHVLCEREKTAINATANEHVRRCKDLRIVRAAR